MENTIAVVDDPLFGEHRAPEAHPERPERLFAARKALGSARIQAAPTTLKPRDASDDELSRVHTPAYVAELDRAAGGRGYLDADTYYVPSSVAAARRAAGGVVAMTESLLAGQARYGLSLVRPPGHHARPDSAMGFCLLNNVAVAAAHALANGARRVAIVDWDVHHGNGTQEMFYAAADVLYASLHQFPFYPGTGAAAETGTGEGRGFTVNVPLSGGAGDGVYIAAVDRLVAPIIEQYDPDLLLISAGFDAHRRDPLAGMQLGDEAYARMLARLATALPRGKEGRLGIVLEGGYDLEGLESSLRATLEALEQPPPPLEVPGFSEQHAADLARAAGAQRPYWRLD